MTMRGPRTPPPPVDEEKLLKKVSEVRIRVYRDYPFFGHLLLKLTPVITRRVPIAGITRQRQLLLNPAWLGSTTVEELAATLIHEVLHLALLFFERQGTRNVMTKGGSLWNVAHDYAINLIIDEVAQSRKANDDGIGLTRPGLWAPPGLIDQAYGGMSAEQIYDKLLAEMPDPDPDDGEDEGEGDDGDGDGEDGDDGGSPGDGDGEDDGDGDGDGDGEDGNGGKGGKPKPGRDKGKGKGKDKGKGKGPPTLPGGGDVFDDGGEGPPSEADLAADKQYWTVAVLEAAIVNEESKKKGNLPGQLQMLIQELREPTLPWRDVLSRWVGENGRRAEYSYARPSRRSEAVGEILPSLMRFGVDDIVVLWDTSGSMGGREVAILSEVVGICTDLQLKLRVICCDMTVHSDQRDVERAEDIDVKGGGGSSFVPAFELLAEERYQGVVIAFTDGVIDVPSVKPTAIRETLWVIWERDVDPTGGAWGQVLMIKDGKAR